MFHLFLKLFSLLLHIGAQISFSWEELLPARKNSPLSAVWPVNRFWYYLAQSDHNSFWPFMVYPWQLFAKCACSFLFSSPFTWFHIITPKSWPQTSAGGQSAASEEHHSLTFIVRTDYFEKNKNINKKKNPSCSHSKLMRQLYIKQRQRLIGLIAHCGSWVTVHRSGSSINWKSVFYSRAWLKYGALWSRDKHSGRWRDMRRACLEEVREERAEGASVLGHNPAPVGGQQQGKKASSSCMDVD